MDSRRCKVCDSKKIKGISLLGAHICRRCEAKIAKIGIETIEYDYYKSVIRKLWIDYIIEAG